MSTPASPFSADTAGELAALIATLHATGQRLEELTAGEVDTVADHEGRTFVLREAQAHLRHHGTARQAAILNALPANIALIDPLGTIVSVNQAWRHFAAANALHAPGHGVGLNYLAICDAARGDHATEAHRVAEGIRSVIRGEARNFSIEYPCHSPLQQRWFLMTASPLSDDRQMGVVVMHVDITAEKVAEEGLRASEARFQQMAENIRDVFFLDDVVASKMLYVNRAYEEIWGRSVESLYAEPKSWIEAIHPDDRAGVQEKFEAGLAGRGPFEFEFRIVRPDGAIRWIETRASPIHEAGGRVRRVTGVAKDVTESKRAAGDLRESERSFRAVLDNVHLVSVMLDSRARITFCNEYLLSLTGWRLDEVLGKDWFETFMPVEVGDMKPVFEQLLLDAPSAWHVENDLLTRSGERRLVRWNNSVLRSGAGNVIGTASIGEDITERKAAEQVLAQRAAELERFHRLSVGREMQMIELKKQINATARQAGQALPYDLSFLDPKPANAIPAHAKSG